jgi:transglutaminase-like putative cysteine protease
VLLIWAVVPMPFLYIVMVPFWMTASLVGLWLALRPAGSTRLSPMVQNIIGVAIVVAVVAAGGIRVGPLRPLGHLLLLLASVRVLLVVDRRSFLKVLPALVLVWLVSLSASTHIAVVPYFALSVCLWWWVGMRLHLLGIVGATELSGSWRTPRVRHAVTAAAVAMLLAVPVFLAMPRLRSPWIAGRGGAESVTGFSDRVELSGVGTIRESQQEAVAVRSVNAVPIEQGWMRLRGTAYDRVTVGSWAPRRPGDERVSSGRTVWPNGRQRRLDGTVELELTLRHPDRYLFLPTGTFAVMAPVDVLTDPTGGVLLADRVEGELQYRVWVTRDEAPRQYDPPRAGGPRFEPPGDLTALAESIVGGANGAAESASAVERYLQENFTYSMQGMASIGPDPVSWFLLRSRRGHCEYFAGGMVVLLDALRVPARMIGGYSGGTASPQGDQVVVREANAHTWVEVWLGSDQGWQVYDPTPAGGVPGLGTLSSTVRLRVAWERLQAGWDRYVLTYGLGEQLRILVALDGAFAGAVQRVRPRHLVWVLVFIASGMVLRWWSRRWVGRVVPTLGRRRRVSPAAHAVDRLRRRLERGGEAVPTAATVRWIGRAAAARWPHAAGEVAELVDLAELELYARSPATDRATVRELWRRARQRMRQACHGPDAGKVSPTT